MNDSNELWYGYLDAGDKSSPVVIDPKLDTGNPKTVYMYNFNSKKITEYKREIAEPKLRALSDKENGMVKDLKSAYDSARKDFTPRNTRSPATPATAVSAAGAKASSRNKVDTNEDNSMDEFDIDDSDIDLDEDNEEDMDSDDDE